MLHALIAEMKIVRVQEKYIKTCRNYIETPNKADILHAATCLQTNSVLISNDRHFNKTRKEQIISVLNVAEALGTLIDEPS